MTQSYQLLEQEWAEFNELDPAGMVACSSGTAALHLAYAANDQLRKGDVAIVPDFTMVACPRAVSLAGLTPVFASACEYDLLASLGAMEDRSSGRIDAYSWMIVHVYGRSPVLDDPVAGAWEPCGLWQVEDLAEAHGVRPHRTTDAACWSFYQNKIVCGEEGGAVWFRDPAVAAVARELRSLGFGPNQDYVHRPGGHNYRLANALADQIRVSIRDYDYNVASRWRSWDAYARQPWDDRVDLRRRPDAPWVFDLSVRGMGKLEQDRLVKTLRDNGIAARHGFVPMSGQPEYRHCEVVGDVETTRRLSRETIYLPLMGIRNQPLPPGEPSRASNLVNTIVRSFPRS